MVINTMAQFLYYYAGMVFIWLGGIAGLVRLGYKFNQYVQSKGGWKSWKKDFFGLEDYK